MKNREFKNALNSQVFQAQPSWEFAILVLNVSTVNIILALLNGVYGLYCRYEFKAVFWEKSACLRGKTIFVSPIKGIIIPGLEHMKLVLVQDIFFHGLGYKFIKTKELMKLALGVLKLLSRFGEFIGKNTETVLNFASGFTYGLNSFEGASTSGYKIFYNYNFLVWMKNSFNLIFHPMFFKVRTNIDQGGL